jgi:hypothetical protein
MANTDNQCKDLPVENDYVKSTHHLERLMTLQKNTQEGVYGYDFANLTLGEIKDFWLWNTRAIEDEISERILTGTIQSAQDIKEIGRASCRERV